MHKSDNELSPKQFVNIPIVKIWNLCQINIRWPIFWIVHWKRSRSLIVIVVVVVVIVAVVVIIMIPNTSTNTRLHAGMTFRTRTPTAVPKRRTHSASTFTLMQIFVTLTTTHTLTHIPSTTGAVVVTPALINATRTHFTQMTAHDCK
jgi:hypothetical protein